MSVEFQKVLEAVGASLASRKEDSVYKRRKITFHSFRRFVKTTIANQTRNSDYSEWFLGHKKSPYYTNKPAELRRIYKEDCMKYLTFLDYPTLETTTRNLEAQLKGVVEQKDKEIAELKSQIQELNNRSILAPDIDANEFRTMKKQLEDLQNQISSFNISKHLINKKE